MMYVAYWYGVTGVCAYEIESLGMMLASLLEANGWFEQGKL